MFGVALLLLWEVMGSRELLYYDGELYGRIRLRFTPLALDDRTPPPVFPWLKAGTQRWGGRSGGGWARLGQSERETETGGQIVRPRMHDTLAICARMTK